MRPLYWLLPICTYAQSLRSREHQHSSRPWPDRKIVYHISPSFNQIHKWAIRRAMNHIEARTCVKYVPRTNGHQDYMFIHPGKICASPVGFVRGRQMFPLMPSCALDGTIMQHELLHSLGLFHEHSRPVRDKYIQINYQDIQPGKEANFYVYRQLADFTGIPYDYNSILHYPPSLFSRNGMPTITARRGWPVIGSLGYITQNDVLKVKRIYQCHSKTFSPPDLCYDIYNSCARNSHKCQSGIKMKRLCRKSCGYCKDPSARPGAFVERPTQSRDNFFSGVFESLRRQGRK